MTGGDEAAFNDARYTWTSCCKPEAKIKISTAMNVRRLGPDRVKSEMLKMCLFKIAAGQGIVSRGQLRSMWMKLTHALYPHREPYSKVKVHADSPVANPHLGT